jgi:hypothetical protein
MKLMSLPVLVWVVGSSSAALTMGAGCSKKEPAAVSEAGDAVAGEPAGRRIDLTDNAEVERVALESVKAYREKNLEKLADLGPPKAREKLIFLEPRNPNYAKLLGDDTWRMKSLKAWPGDKLTKISRGIDDVALGWYHQDETYEYAVEVRKVDGKWTFFDLVQKEKAGAAKPAADAVATPPSPGAAPTEPAPAAAPTEPNPATP